MGEKLKKLVKLLKSILCESIRLQRQRELWSKHHDQEKKVNLTYGDTCPQGALVDCGRSAKGVDEDEKDFQQDVLG